MKKTITLLATLILVAFCSQGVLTLPRPVNLPADALPKKTPVEVGQRIKIGAPAQQLPVRNLEDDDANLYAYRLFATAGEMHGWYNFSAKYPENLEMVKSFGNAAGDYGISASTIANGKTYAYIFQHYGNEYGGWNDFQYPVGIAVMDYTTGEFEVKYSTEFFHSFDYNVLFYDMAYDPVTDKIYACEFAYTESGEYSGMMNIYTIDPETCEPTLIGNTDAVFTAMAADNGKIYGLTQYFDESANKAITSLISFNPAVSENGLFKTEKVCDIVDGDNIVYSIQTMEFDLTTHRLYWLGFRALSDTNYQGIVAEIDLTNGKLVNEAVVPYNAQYLALTIPYQLVADNAPARVQNMTVTPGANGANEANISWTNPTQTYQLASLSELTGVKIYRDGELIETMATTEVGAEMSYHDTNVPSGTHTYKLVPYNTAGDGLYKEYTVFVGQDTPSNVINITTQVELDQLTISWNAPTAGVNGGWFNTEELKYDVYRGTSKIADKITTTSVIDQVTEYKSYEYSIVPSTNAGDGPASSIRIAFGPAVELPYENQLESEERAYELIAIDNDRNGVTWEYSDGFQGYVYSTSMADGQMGDDYLVLPHMELTKGKKYQVRFYYYTGNYGTDCYEKLQLLVGKGSKPENLTTVVKDFAFLSDLTQGAQWHETYTEYLATEDGLFNFAFKCQTEEEIGFIVISWIEVREVGELEAEAFDVYGPSEAYVGSASEFTVRVRNIGSSDIESATVKLLNIDGKVLSELPIENIAVDEQRDVNISWIPETEGTYDVYGVIRIDGSADKYDWDDVTGTYVHVNVNAQDSDRWIVIGEDKPNTYYDMVIPLANTYGRSQWFFYPDEIGRDLTITGIRLHYTATSDADLLSEVPLVIKMQNTERDALIDGGYRLGDDFEPTENMTVVFDGVVNISGTDKVTNVLEVVLDNPFEYTSTHNLLIEFSKSWDEKFANVWWHMDINPKYKDRMSSHIDAWGDPIPYGRGGCFNSNVPYENDNWNTATDYFPHIKLSYKDEMSIENIDVNSNINITVTDKAICFSEVCELAELYAIAGNKVASAKNVNTLTTDYLHKGVYLVKAIADGKIVTKKVMIK